MASPKHLIAQSSNGSLFAVLESPSSSVIRCYDGNISSGSLKFTLRIPPKSTSAPFLGGVEQQGVNDDPIRKLVFAVSSSPSRYLCALREYTILIFDLDRGVVSHTINVREEGHANNSKGSSGKKGRKKSSTSAAGGDDFSTKAILCDAVLTENTDQLCVLVFFPSSEGIGGGGKCRIYQYDLAAAERNSKTSSSGLKRKIKVGSVSSSSSSRGYLSFGVALSSSTTSSSSSSANTRKGERIIAIRMNDGLRVCDFHSGDKLGKGHIPLLLEDTSHEGKGGGEQNEGLLPMISLLRLSTCSGYLATATMNHIVIFKLPGGGGDDNDEDGSKKKSFRVVAQLLCKDDSKITHLELVNTKKDGELNVLAFQPLPGTVSLFTVSCDDAGAGGGTSYDSSSLPPQLPKAQLQCDQGNNNISLIHSTFHSRKPNEEILVLFQNVSFKREGSSNYANLPMQSISYDRDTIEGTVTVGAELCAESANDNHNGKMKKKRKIVANSVALAPGDQGNEASLAMDLTAKKKAREEKESDGGGLEEDEGDFQLNDEEEDGGEEQGQSIAERLALLSSAMEDSDDDEDDDDDDDEGDEQDGRVAAATKKSKFKLKSATSETLTTLLTQALTSNDSVQLNIALQVTDRRIVEGTVRSLQGLDAERMKAGISASSTGYISMLMGHIVRRMARRHSLVVPLGVWVKAILLATSRAATNRTLHPNVGNDVEEQIAKDARDIALKLGPLRNFLNERVECFPQLLRLEGRLALLSEQL